MPNIKSATKRMELSRKWAEANRARRSKIRTLLKKVRTAESKDDAEAHFSKAVSLLDRAATKRLMHPNKVARIKSRLSKHIQSLA